MTRSIDPTTAHPCALTITRSASSNARHISLHIVFTLHIIPIPDPAYIRGHLTSRRLPSHL